MKKAFRSVLLILTAVLLTLLCSCLGNKKSAALSQLCDTLRGSYTCTLSFRSESAGNILAGSAELCHAETLTELTITSPELLSGMNIRYDTVGAPSSVAVHFAGIDAELPTGALAKINRVAALAADDFVKVLSTVGADAINEYDVSESETGYFSVIPYGEAEITLCFSADGGQPYSLEFVSPEITASVVFDSFQKTVEEVQPEE